MFRRIPPAASDVCLRADDWQRLIRADASCLAELESALLEKLQCSAIKLVDSGTSALALALRALPTKVFAVPAFGCYDIITALRGAGASAITYDIQRETLDVDLNSLREAFVRGAGAVVITGLYGCPVNVGEVCSLARRFNARVVEDIAQSMGASFSGVGMGLTGDIVVLSFGRGKSISAAGGGAVLARTSEIPIASTLGIRQSRASVFAGLCLQRIFSDPMLFGIPSAIPFLKLGETIYHEPSPEGGIHPSQAFLALKGLEQLEEIAGERMEKLRRVRTDLHSLARVRMVVPAAGGEATGLRLPALLNALPTRRMHQLGVRRGYPLPLSRHPAMQPCLVATAVHPGAEALAKQLVTIPTHRAVRESDIQAITAEFVDADR